MERNVQLTEQWTTNNWGWTNLKGAPPTVNKERRENWKWTTSCTHSAFMQPPHSMHTMGLESIWIHISNFVETCLSRPLTMPIGCPSNWKWGKTRKFNFCWVCLYAGTTKETLMARLLDFLYPRIWIGWGGSSCTWIIPKIFLVIIPVVWNF